jgi:2-polyprenyl-3-methyl-5-hydroxy-6-metoxy-1,4-benzoquinol methylase
MNPMCRLCGRVLPAAPLFELPGMPAGAQYYPTPAEFTDDRGIDLRLFVCPVCELYQLDAAPVSYFRDVIRPSGFSKMMIDFRSGQFAELVRRFGLAGKKVFECGCGQGEFLELWKKFPVEARGIEQNPEFVALAQSRGLTVEQGFVGSGDDQVAGGPFDAFTSFNFLEHQPDPNGMLQGISRNLNATGAGLITVPNLDYIVGNSAYYELIVDHLTYFSRKTFTAILERNGFRVVGFDETLPDTLCAFVQKVTGSKTNALGAARDRLDAALRDFIEEHRHPDGAIAVWGASHQGFTMLSSAGIAGDVAFIIDSAPFKHGKFSPVSHRPIEPPDRLAREAMAAILVIAPNYSEEIYRTIREKYGLACPVGIVRTGTLEVRK